MKNAHPLFALLFGLFLFGCAKTSDPVIATENPHQVKMPVLPNIDFVRPEIPAYIAPDNETATERNSYINVYPGTNQIQALINSASPGTTLRLMPGTHLEENTLVLFQRINIVGQQGSVLELGGPMGILVTDASKVNISNLEINNTGTSLLGIGVEQSPQFTFAQNTMTGFTYSLVLEFAYKASITGNTIVGASSDGLGITVVNGEKVDISANQVSINRFGIWACDKDGKCFNNVVTNNIIGIILCKVPAGTFSPFFPSGTGGSLHPGTNWRVVGNEANYNVWGYIAIDGANNNFLANNQASNSYFVDLELAYETNNLFSFFTPTSENNTVQAGNLNYIDCGVNNTVHNGNPVALPCSN